MCDIFISLQNVESISKVPADVGIELRLDLFEQIDFGLIEHTLRTSPHPVMLTVRSKGHGGRYAGEREGLLSRFLKLKPPFLDLEYDLSPEFLNDAFEQYPGKIVLSAHNVSDLNAVYRQMSQYPAYTYKLAVPVTSTIEALELFLFAKTLKINNFIPMW
ncbi:MAG: type I 3-dehydroquinate dehydratase, partial [Nitrosotalea sp.]